jgi:hypothetical protein
MRTPAWDLSRNHTDLDLDDMRACADFVEHLKLPNNRTLAALKLAAMRERRQWEATNPASEPFAGIWLTEELRSQLLEGDITDDQVAGDQVDEDRFDA